MIYTIGQTTAYEENFKNLKVVEKLGRTKDYAGGSVWKTKKEALKNCPADYSVYGVEADWDRDTVPSKEGSWHDLINTSVLVRL